MCHAGGRGLALVNRDLAVKARAEGAHPAAIAFLQAAEAGGLGSLLAHRATVFGNAERRAGRGASSGKRAGPGACIARSRAAKAATGALTAFDLFAQRSGVEPRGAGAEPDRSPPGLKARDFRAGSRGSFHGWCGRSGRVKQGTRVVASIAPEPPVGSGQAIGAVLVEGPVGARA